MGHWKKPGLIPRGRLEWHAPPKTGLQVFIGTIQDKLVAKIKKHAYQPGYAVTIEGWVWTAFPPNSVTAKLNVTESDSIGFDTLREAKLAVRNAIALLP